MIRKITFLTLLAIFSPDSLSEERWYDIEFIFFEHTQHDNVDAELWDDQLRMMQDPLAVALFDPQTSEPLSLDESLRVNEPLNKSITNPVSSILTTEELTMGDRAKKVDKYHGFNLIMHFGWRQLFTDNQKVKIHVFGGTDYSTEFGQSGLKRETAQENPVEQIQVHPWDVASLLQETLSPTELHLWKLDGFIEINLAHYMHIAADFVIRKPLQEVVTNSILSTTGPLDTAKQDELTQKERLNNVFDDGFLKAGASRQIERLKQFKLQQKRKLKSHDVHYIDHPLLGIIMKIQPYDHNKAMIEERLGTRPG